MADIYNAFVQGRQNGEARRTKRTLSQYLQGALGGDQAALTQIYAADPNAGMQAQKLGRETQNDNLEDVAKAAQFYSQTRDPKAYQYMHGRLATMPQFAGMPATLDTPEDQEGAVKFAQAIAQTYGKAGPAELAPRVVGRSLVDATGKVLFEAPEEQEYQWSERAGAWIPKPRAGGGAAKTFEDGSRVPPPSMSGTDGMPVTIDPGMSAEDIKAVQAMEGGPIPGQFSNGPGRPLDPPGLAAIPVAGIGPKPDISPVEERRLQLAEEAAARAREAADRSRLGNAPAGFRFRPDGSLEAIPGGPKPAGSAATEDERKAAGWLTQSRKAFDDMEAALAMDTEADTPGILETYVPIDEVANRSRSPARQKYVQGSSAFSEAVLRAATGAGVNRDEAIQKIREVTPQRGDSDAVKAQKRESLRAYLQSLEQRAGRAATGARPAATPAATGPKRVQSAADYDTLPSGALFIAPDGTQRRKR